MAKIVLDPITRIEGHMKFNVTLSDTGVVTDARVSGNLFRDFENILTNRTPNDATYLTQRICGVCPTEHAVASVKAVENAIGFTPNLQGILLRNLIQGANFIASSILHFYHLAAMDYIKGPHNSPWAPSVGSDLRLSPAITQAVIDHYVIALSMRRKAQDMGAIFGGKLPHVASIVPGGCTTIPTAADITKYKSLLAELSTFLNGIYASDLGALANVYYDYFNIGKGNGNLITYGVFDQSISGNPLFPAGTVINGSTAPSIMNTANITEDVKYSWYTSPSGQNPSVEITTPSASKAGAYSWIKAPRYNGQPFEAGPLARTWMSGDYRNGISTMDRHAARHKECQVIASKLLEWVNTISPLTSGYLDVVSPVSGDGIGLTEAGRGALGHWISIGNSLITKYQIITPTCWNGSPADDIGNLGPIEKALIGVHVEDSTQPVELIRIVHSFDPCTACAVHVISPIGEEMSKFIVTPI